MADWRERRGGKSAAIACAKSAGATPEHPVAAALGCGDDPTQVVVGLGVEYSNPWGQHCIQPTGLRRQTRSLKFGDQVAANLDPGAVRRPGILATAPGDPALVRKGRC